MLCHHSIGVGNVGFHQHVVFHVVASPCTATWFSVHGTLALVSLCLMCSTWTSSSYCSGTYGRLGMPWFFISSTCLLARFSIESPWISTLGRDGTRNIGWNYRFGEIGSQHVILPLPQLFPLNPLPCISFLVCRESIGLYKSFQLMVGGDPPDIARKKNHSIFRVSCYCSVRWILLTFVIVFSLSHAAWRYFEIYIYVTARSLSRLHVSSTSQPAITFMHLSSFSLSCRWFLLVQPIMAQNRNRNRNRNHPTDL